MAYGKLLRFDETRGYGFIAPDEGGEDVFIHANDFTGDKSLLCPGARVEFDIEAGSRGLKASAVHIVAPLPGAQPRPVVGTRSDGQGDDEVYCDVLTYADFKLELTEALLHGVPSLTGEQVIQARNRILELMQAHNWVDG